MDGVSIFHMLWVVWLMAATTHAQWTVEVQELVTTSFVEGEFYEAACVGRAARRDSAAAPPRRPMRFRRVFLTGCVPPANGTYRDLLAAVNVTADEALRLAAVPAAPTLSARSFDGLGTLGELDLSASQNETLEPEPGYLSALVALRSLRLRRVRVRERLPPRLDRLRLRAAGLRALPPEALSVVVLEVAEPQLVLESPLEHCERMRELTLADIPAENLPPGLVAACGSLESLSLVGVQTRSLPPALLRGAVQLRRLTLADARLAALPADLLAHSPRLTTVNLTDIQLVTLPNELFSQVKSSLLHVDLSRNRLRARSLVAARAASALRTLRVDDNPLGNLCEHDNATSVLSGLSQLKELHLSHTNLTLICTEWLRGLPALRVLDLAHNAVRRASCAQLQARDQATVVLLNLTGNPLERIQCSEEDFDAAEEDVPLETTVLVLDSRLSCDCDAYWLARVLRERGLRARVEPRCAPVNSSTSVISSDLPLRHAPLGALACPLAPAHCARTCACEYAPHAGGVRARCFGPGLPVGELVKLTQAQGYELVELHARDAGVTELSAELPPSLKLLDVENNSISRASTNATARLFDGGRRVRLARNPLVCNCSNRPLLDTLRTHRHLVLGYGFMRCADGRALEPVTDALDCSEEPRSEPAALAGLAAGALVMIVLVGLLAGALARPESRLRLKALLHARGVRWLARRLDAPDEDRDYDVFVSHADTDSRFVAEEIVPKLEPELRLCLWYREWAAGAWIPAQIDASVRRARRSLCVLSPRALASRWARAELRAAHAHALRENTPRLVLLLLDVRRSELRADEELRAVLDAHAHVRWGERCFWEKLRYTLPEPRARPPAATPA